MCIVYTLYLSSVAIRRLVLNSKTSKAFAKTFCVLLYGSYLFVALLYYLLVLSSKAYIGEVASWHLLFGYVGHINTTLEVLGIPLWLVILSLCILLIVSVTLAVLASTWICWPELSQRKLPPISRGLLFLAFAHIIGLIAGSLAFANGYWVWYSEPLSLSSFPRVISMQNHAVDAGKLAALDYREEMARQAYTPGPVPSSRPNLIVFVVDGLRPDHMSLFGYPRQTTPYLEQRRRNAWFLSDRVYSSCAESFCGIASLLSGRFLHQLPSKPITIHETLKHYGYERRFLLSGDHDNFYQLADALYGARAEQIDTEEKRSMRYINNDHALLGFSDQLPDASDTPLFIHYHLMSAHSLGERFLEPQYTPELNHSRPDVSLRAEEPSVLKAVRNRYDNGVIQTDWMIEQLLIKLQQKGYLENAIVLITADHGELLGDNGQFGHAKALNEAEIRVPLIMLRYPMPDSSPKTACHFGSLAQVSPALAKLIGIKPPVVWEQGEIPFPGNPLLHIRQRNHVGVVINQDCSQAYKLTIDLNSGEERVDLLIDGQLQPLEDSSQPNAETLERMREAIDIARNSVSEAPKRLQTKISPMDANADSLPAKRGSAENDGAEP
jgi:glucan phosphoethanolaminetransferase (alkaline phosphatase superfamily)